MSAVHLHASSAHNCGVAPRACVSGREGKGREGIGRDRKGRENVKVHPSVTGGSDAGPSRLATTSAGDGCASRSQR